MNEKERKREREILVVFDRLFDTPKSSIVSLTYKQKQTYYYLK